LSSFSSFMFRPGQVLHLSDADADASGHWTFSI
jgi:hypothetical protein